VPVESVATPEVPLQQQSNEPFTLAHEAVVVSVATPEVLQSIEPYTLVHEAVAVSVATPEESERGAPQCARDNGTSNQWISKASGPAKHVQQE
jgi:hypothetical protein